MTKQRGGIGILWKHVVQLSFVATFWGIATMATAQIASSQGRPPSAPPQNGISFDGEIEVLSDSNVLRIAAPSLLNSGAHRADFRYSPEVTVTYGRGMGVITMEVNGLVGRDLFQYNRYLDSNRFGGGGSLTYHSGSNCNIVADGNYSSRQSGIYGSDATDVDTSGTPGEDVGAVIDNVLTSTTYGVSAGCGAPSGRLSIGGGYVRSSFSNDAAIRKFADSNSETFSGNVGIGVFRPGQLYLNGSYTTIDYPNRIAGLINNIGQLPDSEVKTYRIGVSFTRPIGAMLSGTIGVSYLHSDPVGAQGAYSSPAYTLELNYAASQRLTFTLTGSRDIVPSVTAGALFRVVDQVLFSSGYSIGPSITINANLGLIGNNYQGGFASFEEPARLHDTTTTAAVGVTYALHSHYRLTLNVTQSNRTSNPSIFNYSSTRVGLSLAIHH